MASDLVFRAASSDEDCVTFGGLMSRSFSIPIDDARAWPDMLGRENVRLLERGNRAIAALAFYPMAQYFGGRAVSCAGVAGVGVEPQERGRGLGTDLMTRGLRELSERGFALAALYPATLQLYGGVGFAVAGGRYELRVPLRALPRSGRDAGAIVPLDSMTDPRMRACYARVARDRAGWLERSEPMWMRIQTRRSISREGWALEREGEIVAYVWLAKKAFADGHFDLDCSEVVASDEASARGILSFLGSYATIGESLVASVALNDPLLEAIPECTWRVSLHLPWMLRIVDARVALEARGYSKVVRARCEISVVDPLLEANAQRFLVDVEGGRARVTPGGSGAIEIDVRGLAAAFSGHSDGASLRARGLARGSANEVDAFAALFAGSAPSMPDFF